MNPAKLLFVIIFWFAASMPFFYIFKVVYSTYYNIYDSEGYDLFSLTVYSLLYGAVFSFLITRKYYDDKNSVHFLWIFRNWPELLIFIMPITLPVIGEILENISSVYSNLFQNYFLQIFFPIVILIFLIRKI